MQCPRLSFGSRAPLALLFFIGAFVGFLRASLAQTPGAPEVPNASAPVDAAADAGAEPAAAPQDDAGAPPATVTTAAPAPATAAPPAPTPAGEGQKVDAHHAERSELVPDVDVRQQKARPIDPKVAFKPGRGLSVTSADGQFEMNTKIRGQILGTFENVHAGDGETLLGMQIRRARFAMQGHWFGKHNKYKFELALSPRDVAMREGNVGTAPLLDWYLTFDYLKQATLVVGQYKVPFNRQRVVSSGALQMVDRSIVQNEFNLDRNVGLDVRSTSLLDGHFHYFAGIYGGEGRNAFELRDSDIVYLARAELLPFGNFSDYVEGDFERTGPRLSIAGSYAHVANSARNQGPLGRAPADGGTTTYNTAEADVLLKMYGLSVTGEFFWREGDRKAGTAVDRNGLPIPVERPRDGYGWFAQVGYLLPRTMFEIEGRYGMMRPTDAGKSSLHVREELGGGVSYYFAQHTFKLQADYFRLWESDKLADGTDQIRLQLEAGF